MITRTQSTGLWQRLLRLPTRCTLSQAAAGFRRNQRGSTAILFALSMPMLIGGLGLGFEVSNWYLAQRGMQNAADAAVMAAAANGGANYDVEGKAVAAQFGFTNGVNNTTVTVLQNVPCPAGGSTCYSATISSSVPLYLSPVVGFTGSGGGQQNIVATAIAKKGTIQRPYCLLALASNGVTPIGGTPAITTNGAPSPNLAGCSVKSNTDANCNGHDLGADYGDAVGTDSGCGKIQNSGLPATVDPYSGLAANIPADTTCGGSYPQKSSVLPVTNTWAGTKTLSGNVIICGDLQLTGNVTVNAPSNAVLVIFNGQLDTNGYTIQTSSGSGLTVVFSGSNGSYTHAPTGNGTLDITAPTSGPWSGVMIYQDPRLTSGVDIADAGNKPNWNITGLVYLPHAFVTLTGAINKSSYGGTCFVAVVDHLLMKGSANIVPKGGCVAAGLTMPTGSSPGRGQLVN